MLLVLILQDLGQDTSNSFNYMEDLSPQTFLNLENPLIYSLLLLLIVFSITVIYFKYIIVPMRQRHLKEQENLRLQQAELMALFAELSPDPVLRCDNKGKIILANNSAHKLYPQNGLLGDQIDSIFPELKTDEVLDIIKNGFTMHFATVVDEKHYQFILIGSQKFEFCQIYGRDVTELKVKEAELKIALKRAEESKRIKEQFLAQISHEIRSPLVVIQGYSEYLRKEIEDNALQDYKDIFLSMENNSKKLYRTVDLLLNMSQIQTGKYEINKEIIDLNSIMQTVHREFLSFAEEKKIKFVYNNHLPEKSNIYADHYSVVQILINLIDNAFKYTSRGTISVNAFEEGERICIEIADTGIGISQEYIDKIFAPFSQEKTGYTRPFEGTGLGLALVKNFIELNNAEIEVKSEVNSGSIFTIKFRGNNK
ncbi:MAG: ATP-binding protein [bacterium]